MDHLLVALLFAQATPNMGLQTSIPGSTPAYQQSVNDQTNIGILDGHNHTPGSGVPVPPAGLNINAPLTFQGNAATHLGAVDFVDGGGGPSVPLTLWTDGIDLCYEDGNANVICLTLNGQVNVLGADGGQNVFTTVTGTSLAGDCLTGSNGASDCFNSAGGEVLTAVDGGSLYLEAPNPIIPGTNVLTVGPGGTTDNKAIQAAGLVVPTGDLVCLDTGCVGSIFESGREVGVNVPDAGGFVISGGGAFTGASPFAVHFNGNSICDVSGIGEELLGDPSITEEFILNPAASYANAGTPGIAKIAVAGVDSSVAIQLIPKGPDGGVVIVGHLDSANVVSGVTAVTDAGPFDGSDVGCFDGGTFLAAGTDQAGVVCAFTGPSAPFVENQCPVNTNLAITGVTFATAYEGATYAVSLTPYSATGFSSYAPVVGWGGGATSFSIYSAQDQIVVPDTAYCWSYQTIGIGIGAH